MASQIEKAFRSNEGIKINGQYILTGTAAPATEFSGQTVPQGSLYLQSDGTLYRKTGAGQTAGDWVVANTINALNDIGDVDTTGVVTNSLLAYDGANWIDTLTVTLNQANIDNIQIDGNTISSTDTNGNVVISPDGTGEARVGINRILTVADEGTGNGLDADTLDGVDSLSFVRSDQNDSLVGNYDITGLLDVDNIRVDGNTISTTDLNGNLTLAPNGTGKVIVTGDLQVDGTTTTVNSNEVNIGDNIIVLNSDEAGAPSQNAGIEVERGTSTNVQFIWNETSDYWTATDGAGTAYQIVTANDSINLLGDVVITTPSNGEILTYNGTNWVNQTAAQSGVNVKDDDVSVSTGATTLDFTETGTADFVVVTDQGANETQVSFNTTDVAVFDNMTTSGAATNDLFVYNGSAFAPSKSLNGISLKNYSEVVHSESTAGPTYNIDLANGNVQEITLTGNVTFDIINEAASGNSSNLVLILVQDATGGRTATFPGSVTWTAGGAPELDTTANAVEILSFFTIDGGTIHYGSHIDSAQPDIDDLNNVTITSVAANEILQFDGSNWINQTLAEAGIAANGHTHTASDITDFNSAADARIAAANIDNLNDVVITTPADNEVLAYNTGTSQWINQTPAEAGLSEVGHTHTSSDITDFTEASQDAVGAAITAGQQTNITVTYDDANNEIDFDASHDLNSHTDTVITTPANGEVLQYNGSNWVNTTIATGATQVSANTITTAATIDEVNVDNVVGVSWFVVVYETGTPANCEALEVRAIHNAPTNAADATAVDYSLYSQLVTGSGVTGLSVSVDLAGSGVAQTIRLRASTTNTTNFRVTRKVNDL